MKKPRFVLLFIGLIVFASILIDWPSVPVKFNLGPIKVDRVLKGPDLNLSRFGISFARKFDVKLGLDLQGGTALTLRADMSDVAAADRDKALEAAKEVIEKRVNGLGVAEALVQTAKVAGEYRIIVELPGINNPDEAKKLVGQTAKLEFRKFKAGVDYTKPEVIPTLENTEPTGVTGKDLQRADAGFNSAGQGTTPGAVVNFEIKSSSQDKFAKVTRELIQKPLMTFLDDQIINYATVQSEIRDKGQISGMDSPDQAKTLAIQLSAGALPVKKIDIISDQSIGATLGKESVEKSLFAGIVGISIVAAFMLIYYGVVGLLADLALLVYALIVLAVFKTIPVTLTLAGIAGFILSIGMAVDANILIFERMKEELREGRSKINATEIGFSRAWNSIRDSNVSSLLTSGILFWLGTGQVKGFALALAIGILVSMFTAIVVTRNFLRLVYRNA
ncbi:MAG: protein translocase subunit SecD [bacterium]|nr:protein translocase subunit SecD [bacterium]